MSAVTGLLLPLAEQFVGSFSKQEIETLNTYNEKRDGFMPDYLSRQDSRNHEQLYRNETSYNLHDSAYKIQGSAEAAVFLKPYLPSRELQGKVRSFKERADIVSVWYNTAKMLRNLSDGEIEAELAKVTEEYKNPSLTAIVRRLLNRSEKELEQLCDQVDQDQVNLGKFLQKKLFEKVEYTLAAERSEYNGYMADAESSGSEINEEIDAESSGSEINEETDAESSGSEINEETVAEIQFEARD